MNQVTQRTLSAVLLVLFSADQTPGSPATVLAAQATSPHTAAGDGTWLFATGADTPGNFLILKPFGIATDGQTANIYLIGWRKICDNTGHTQWTSEVLADLTVTFGAALGTSGGLAAGSSPLKSTHSVAKSIVINAGLRASLTAAGTNPAVQNVQLDPAGCQIVQAIIGTGSATKANLAVAPF